MKKKMMFLEELMNTKFKTLVIDREVTGRSDVPVVFTARFNRTSDETVHVFDKSEVYRKRNKVFGRVKLSELFRLAKKGGSYVDFFLLETK